MKLMRSNFKKAFVLLLSGSLLFSSCKEEEVFPVPTVSAGSALSGTPGSKVTISATISAPGGLKSITVLKNGAAFDTKTYMGETNATYTSEYTIETLSAGTVVNFTVLATDNSGQSSTCPNLTFNEITI